MAQIDRSKIFDVQGVAHPVGPGGLIYPNDYPEVNREEPDRALTGDKWWGRGARTGTAGMMMQYPHVSAVVESISILATQSRFECLPADENDSQSVDVAAQIEAAILGRGQLNNWLKTFFDYLYYGFLPSFVSWDTVNGIIAPVDFMKMEPRWIDAVVAVDGRLSGLRYTSSWVRSGGGQFTFLPIDSLFWLTHKPSAFNYFGVPFIRPMYAAWRRASALQNFESIQAEHLSGGVLLIKEPKDGNMSKADIEELKEQAAKVRNNAQGFMVLPKGLDAVIAAVQAGKYSMEEAILREQRDIYAAAGADVLRLGIGGEGSLALGKEKSSIFLATIRSLALEILGQFTEQVLTRCVAINWGVENVNRLTPRLDIKDVRNDAALIIPAIAQAITSGALTPDTQLEDVVREMLGIPMLTGDEVVGDDEVDATLSRRHTHAFVAGKKKALWRRDKRKSETYVDFARIVDLLNAHGITAKRGLRIALNKRRDERIKELQRFARDGGPLNMEVMLTESDITYMIEAFTPPAQRSYKEGRKAIKAEIKRQKDGETVDEINDERQEIVASRYVFDGDKEEDYVVKPLATLSAHRLNRRLLERYHVAARNVLRDGKTSLTDEEAAGILDHAEIGQSSIVANSSASDAYNGGRESAVKDALEKGDPLHFERSALLDSGTCLPCEDLDGTEFDNYNEMPVPEESCESNHGGVSQCRCLNLIVLD